jgi:hypothetical protein
MLQAFVDRFKSEEWDEKRINQLRKVGLRNVMMDALSRRDYPQLKRPPLGDAGMQTFFDGACALLLSFTPPV